MLVEPILLRNDDDDDDDERNDGDNNDDGDEVELYLMHVEQHGHKNDIHHTSEPPTVSTSKPPDVCPFNTTWSLDRNKNPVLPMIKLSSFTNNEIIMKSDNMLLFSCLLWTTVNC